MKKRLTAAEVSMVKPGLKVRKLYDGNGLMLRVMPTGGKQWIWYGTIDGIRRSCGLGGYPYVSLKEAREKAFEYKKIARSGGDPRPKKAKNDIPTFTEAFEEWFKLNLISWSDGHAIRNRGLIENHVLPRIGKIPVNRVNRRDLMACLSPLTDRPETMKRLHQRISGIMNLAVSQEYRADNPTVAILDSLPKQNGARKHHLSLHYSEVKGAIATIRGSAAEAVTKLAFEFLILTASRSGDVRGATWKEVDLKKRVWIIPAARMKMKKEHRVPLSKRALEILREAKKLGSGSDLVFPGRTGKELGSATLAKLASDLVLNAVPHGFRASFTTWAAENNVGSVEVQEACEARMPKGVRGRYQRSDFLEERRGIMDRWAAYISL